MVIPIFIPQGGFGPCPWYLAAFLCPVLIGAGLFILHAAFDFARDLYNYRFDWSLMFMEIIFVPLGLLCVFLGIYVWFL